MVERTPRTYTARELAEALAQYGDMEVVVSVVDSDDHAMPLASMIRPELTGIRGGNHRTIALVGYLPLTEDE